MLDQPWALICRCQLLTFSKKRIVSDFDQEIPQSQTAGEHILPLGRATQNITRLLGDTLSIATSSLYPIKVIAKTEWTYSNAQQNIEKKINNELTNRTTALERTAA